MQTVRLDDVLKDCPAQEQKPTFDLLIQLISQRLS